MKQTLLKIKVLEHNFFHVKNNWILIGKGSKALPHQIAQIVLKGNQVIHWFIDNPDKQLNAFNVEVMNKRVVGQVHPTPLYIHVPKYAKQHLEKVYHWFTPYGLVATEIICESIGPMFRVQDNHNYMLNIKYSRFGDQNLIKAESYFGCSGDNLTGLNDYLVNHCIGASNPLPDPSEKPKITLTKESQIANFKARTPLVILKSFKDDEDIWAYIVAEQKAISAENKQIITRSVQTYMAPDASEKSKNEAIQHIQGVIADVFKVPKEVFSKSEKDGKITFSMHQKGGSDDAAPASVEHEAKIIADMFGRGAHVIGSGPHPMLPKETSIPDDLVGLEEEDDDDEGEVED